MSASLVGSEMCIRDRGSGGQSGARAPRGATKASVLDSVGGRPRGEHGEAAGRLRGPLRAAVGGAANLFSVATE
eukprot:8362139-Alexandrium_andersonii.AAC.1